MNSGKKSKTPLTGSFENMSGFSDIAPAYHQEVTRIINKQLSEFVRDIGRKPSVLDIGAAGVLSFDVTMAEKICILDVFQKPDHIILPDNAKWIIHNILDEELPGKEKYDFVILSGLLHHLADKHNNIRKHMELCLKNVRNFMAEGGYCLIVESICPPYFDKIQDVLYPITSRILAKVLRFPYARMLSLKEITTVLNVMTFNYRMIDFNQLTQHYCAGYKVPSKIYPISYVCIKIMG